MVDLSRVTSFLADERGLCVVGVGRADGSVSMSVVNAGVLAHPVGGATVVGFVIRANTYKHRRLSIDPRVTITVRSGWQWQAVEGTAELIGPLDPPRGASVDVPALLRTVFQAAGGTHDNWAEYDRVMAEEKRTAVLVDPRRVYGIVSA